MNVPHTTTGNTKPCSRCKQTLPLESFSINRSLKSGRCSDCKQCQALYFQRKKNGTFVPREPAMTADGKRCSKCRVRKQLSEYSRNAAQKDGLHNYCEGCRKGSVSPEYKRTYHAKYWPKYYDQNCERDRSKGREYYRCHKEQLKPVRSRWSEKNPEKRRASYERYHKAHPEKRKLYYLENRQEFRRRDHIRRSRSLSNGGSYNLEDWYALCLRYESRCLCCKQQKPLTVDHVIPIALGGTSNIDNLQPLCLKCNMSKGKKHIDYRAIP